MSRAEGMRAHQWPGIDPCTGRPLFPAAPGGLLSAVIEEEQEKEEEEVYRERSGLVGMSEHP